jgi:hypothetical protein
MTAFADSKKELVGGNISVILEQRSRLKGRPGKVEEPKKEMMKIMKVGQFETLNGSCDMKSIFSLILYCVIQSASKIW